MTKDKKDALMCIVLIGVIVLSMVLVSTGETQSENCKKNDVENHIVSTWVLAHKVRNSGDWVKDEYALIKNNQIKHVNLHNLSVAFKFEANVGKFCQVIICPAKEYTYQKYQRPDTVIDIGSPPLASL